MTSPSLTPLFSPRGIVVVGASTSPHKLGYGVARNLVHCGYPGAVHFVGQKPGTLFGRPLYTDLGQVPDPGDMAVLISRGCLDCRPDVQAPRRGRADLTKIVA